MTKDVTSMFKMLSLALFWVVRHIVVNYNTYNPSIIFKYLGFFKTPIYIQYETYISHPYNYEIEVSGIGVDNAQVANFLTQKLNYKDQNSYKTILIFIIYYDVYNSINSS